MIAASPPVERELPEPPEPPFCESLEGVAAIVGVIEGESEIVGEKEIESEIVDETEREGEIVGVTEIVIDEEIEIVGVTLATVVTPRVPTIPVEATVRLYVES